MLPAASSELPSQPAPADDGPRGRGAKPILVVCGAGLLLTLLIYSPGYMSWDSLDQLKQARAGVLRDNHPPLMAAIWSITDPILPGPSGMLLLQTLLFWGGIAVFFTLARGALPMRMACAVLVGLFPPIFGLIGTIWKDLLMLGALLLALALIMRFQKKKGIMTGLAIFGLLVVGTGVRHNAASAIPALLFWLAHSFGFVHARRRVWTMVRAGLLAVAGFAVVYCCASALSARLTDQKCHFWQYLPVYDVAGISVRTNQVLFPDDCPLLRHPVKLEDLEKGYSECTVAKLYRVWKDDSSGGKNRFHTVADEDSLADLSSLWRKSIRDHPREYLQHRWAVFANVIGLTSRRVDTPIYGLYGPKIVKNDLGLIFHESVLNRAVTNWLIRLAKTPLYRVWVYLIILLVLLPIGLALYLKTHDVATLAMSASGLLYVLSLFFVAASGNFRYSLWGLAMAVICVAYLLCLATTLFSKANRQRPEDPSVGDHSSEARPV